MDDGKRSDALGVSLALPCLYKGRGLGRGSCQVDPDKRLVDFFIGVMLALFSHFFRVLF